MGREHRTEGRARGTESPVQRKRFVIVGAPSTGKVALVNAVAQRLDDPIAISGNPTVAALQAMDVEVGNMADYRTELKIAVDRAFSIDKSSLQMPTIYTHSLLDSLAYATLRFGRFAEHRNVSVYSMEKAALVVATIGALLKDTFRADHIFFIEFALDGEGDAERAKIQSRLKMIWMSTS